MDGLPMRIQKSCPVNDKLIFTPVPFLIRCYVHPHYMPTLLRRLLPARSLAVGVTIVKTYHIFGLLGSWGFSLLPWLREEEVSVV